MTNKELTDAQKAYLQTLWHEYGQSTAEAHLEYDKAMAEAEKRCKELLNERYREARKHYEWRFFDYMKDIES